jgi:hypothetical protein
MAGCRVELFAAIRRDSRVDALSIRELAVKHRVHRRTVRRALSSAIRHSQLQESHPADNPTPAQPNSPGR